MKGSFCDIKILKVKSDQTPDVNAIKRWLPTAKSIKFDQFN